MALAPAVSPLSRFTVDRRSIVITGATGALGSAAARALNALGARLTLAGGNADKLDALAADLNGPGPVVTVRRRPDTPDEAEAILSAAVRTYGDVHGLLVASGTNHVAPITEMKVEDFDAVQSANVRGSWLMCQAAGRHMLGRDGGGSVVLVSSTRGRLGHPAGYSAYCPSKAAVDLLGRSLAAEWGSAGVRVNVLAPTVFRSELTAWMYEDDEKATATRAAMLARVPLGRLAEPEDFAGALIYLLSDASSFVTGQVLYLDGGYTAC
ncbi:SDR family oxidoreductase [Streptomyces sp. ISL-36]|uniref:SDR family NAD(P)-dependent oxidoreductase n=1 Tax=Streptomyces sp. ISL-36 TaxID=2819182 RepID=UPI001BE5EC71|nr:SDR family oxidoreductase [Streptomyces sp. ISL-36]MBT2440230.1 SDR family oxidoreductase [Streptomyces sp. ISL-36]